MWSPALVSKRFLQLALWSPDLTGGCHRGGLPGGIIKLRSIGLFVLAAVLLPQLLALPFMAGGITDTQDRVQALEKREVAGPWVNSNFPIVKAGQQITVVEASIFDSGDVDATANWLGDHAQDGRILVSAQANRTATLMFHSAGFHSLASSVKAISHTSIRNCNHLDDTLAGSCISQRMRWMPFALRWSLLDRPVSRSPMKAKGSRCLRGLT